MDIRVPRRELLKTLGLAAVGSTACHQMPKASTPEPIRLPRVNLICHGLMLFWQDKTKPKDGIRIYIPNTNNSHVVRLSTNVGGLPSLIDMQGNYVLQLTRTGASRAGKPDKAADVALFDENSTKGLAVNTANTPWQIDIPYPTSVRRFRLMKFPANHPPYDTTSSDTASTFDVRPREMAGAHVFTYDGVSTAITLQKPDGTTVSVAPREVGLLNLHFYASAEEMEPANHLRFFNSMLKYTGHPQLDLAVTNQNPKTIPKEQDPVPADLSHLEVYDLYELAEANSIIRSADPVGCLQGWGS